jgi:hypothetical protein
MLNTQGDALADLAEVLSLAHRPSEAVSVVEQAAERYERKGNRVSLERARSLAQELAPANPARYCEPRPPDVSTRPRCA